MSPKEDNGTTVIYALILQPLPHGPCASSLYHLLMLQQCLFAYTRLNMVVYLRIRQWLKDRVTLILE